MEGKHISVKTTETFRTNESIRVRQVRLIGAEGESLGIVSRDEALRLAADASLDLVEISPNADPPVCKILNYGKFIYEQSKKQAAAKKKQRQVSVKEVKFRPGTDEGDIQVKLRNLIRFLQSGDKVKITLRFRGRELSHQELGMELLQRVQKELEEFGTLEQTPKREGRQMVMVLSPKKKA